MRKTCLRMIYELAKQDERIVFIGSDLGAGVLEEFKREMPDRFFMEGVAEQNLVGMAAGLALSGKIVYVNTIATFLTRRAYEQVCIDVGLHKANVRLIGNGGGAVYAPLGPTHIATDDIALMRTIPGMTIWSLADAPEMEAMMPSSVGHSGPLYIRLGRGGDPVVSDKFRAFGDATLAVKAQRLSRPLIITTGTTTQIAVEAAKVVDISVLHVPVLKPFPAAKVIAHALCHPRIITLEDHSIIGGLGACVAETLSAWDSDDDLPGTHHPIGYPDCFPEGYGTQDEMRARYGISVENIVKTVKELCGAK